MKELKKTVLIVDDDIKICNTYSDFLKRFGYFPIIANNFRDAIRLFSLNNPCTVLLDYDMPSKNGFEVLSDFKNINSFVPVIVITGLTDINLAVNMIKNGAYDFLHKPPDFDKLIISINRAFENFSLKSKVKNINYLNNNYKWILGNEKNSDNLINEIKNVATSNFSILLEGETGTGKSFIADLIHRFSTRKDRSFVKVDIGSIPESLIEKELFGNEKGAYTGADRRHIGYFESSSGGTLFIDELENMSAFIQSKLLTVVEDKKISLVGSTKKIDCDFRLVCATNKNIEKAVSRDEFRADLLYRIAEYIIRLEPLRKRKEDILFFANKFLRDANIEMNKNIESFSESAIKALLDYKWPGNIRELKTVIRKATFFCKSNQISDLDLKFFNVLKIDDLKNDSYTMKSFVSNAEYKAISNALKLASGNKSKTATLLEISYKTLLSKIKEYNL